jgi:hypothetical protein
LRSRQLRNYTRIYQYFMVPEVSLPCSQGPSTNPYPEPDQSSPYQPILILSARLRLGLPSGLFPSGIRTKILCAYLFFLIHPTCSAHLILLDIINTSYKAPNYAAFSNLLSLHRFLVQIFSSAPCSQTPAVYVTPLMS